jgi:hypothetical protein
MVRFVFTCEINRVRKYDCEDSRNGWMYIRTPGSSVDETDQRRRFRIRVRVDVEVEFTERITHIRRRVRNIQHNLGSDGSKRDRLCIK